MINSLALLAGGLATRLKPVTETIPKSLIEINGKPFISHQLELLRRNGINKIVICTGFLGDIIKEYLDKNPVPGLEIKYSFDGDRLLGTGGALKKALDLIDDPFFVMYGDSYLNTDFKIINEYFLSQNKKGLMTVFKNDNLWDKSNVLFRNGKILEYNKKSINNEMNYIDYGLGVLTKSSFSEFKNKGIFDLEEVYKSLLGKGELAGFEVKERFYEIGSFEGIKETAEFLSSPLKKL